MTSKPLALMLAVALLAMVAIAVMWETEARGENYGSATVKQQAFAERAIHDWFDRQGVGGTMECIASRESGLAAIAYNDDDWPRQGVAGLFQIAYPLWTANNPRAPAAFKRFWHYRPVSWQGFKARLADPVQSIRLAFILYRHSGLEPWGGGC
jgi:hypothetical protein